MKNKIYELIGRTVVFLTAYSSVIMFIIWAFEQNTIY